MKKKAQELSDLNTPQSFALQSTEAIVNNETEFTFFGGKKTLRSEEFNSVCA